MRAQGTTTVEIKSGYGLSVDRRGAGAAAGRRGHRRDHLPRRPRRARRSGGTTRAATWTWSPATMLHAAAPYARWIDVFCEPASPHAFDGDEARRCCWPAGRPGWACGCTATSSARPGRAAGRRARRGQRRPLHLPDGRRRRRAGRRGRTTVATLLPGVEFCTRSPYPDARRLLAAGVSIALATDCNPGTCYSSSMPFMIALAVREMGLTPARRCTPQRPDRPGRCAVTTSAGSGSRARPTSPCWTPRATSISPTGPACRSLARSSCRSYSAIWPRTEARHDGPGVERTITLTEAVVAIAMTSLILPLVEVVNDVDVTDLVHALGGERSAPAVVRDQLPGHLRVLDHPRVSLPPADRRRSTSPRVGSGLINTCRLLVIAFLPFPPQWSAATSARSALRSTSAPCSSCQHSPWP